MYLFVSSSPVQHPFLAFVHSWKRVKKGISSSLSHEGDYVHAWIRWNKEEITWYWIMFNCSHSWWYMTHQTRWTLLYTLHEFRITYVYIIQLATNINEKGCEVCGMRPWNLRIWGVRNKCGNVRVWSVRVGRCEGFGSVSMRGINVLDVGVRVWGCGCSVEVCERWEYRL